MDRKDRRGTSIAMDRTHQRGNGPDISNQVEGRNPVLEALRAKRPIEKVLIAKGELTGSIKEIIRLAKQEKYPIQYVDRQRLDEISASHSHQGVIAMASAHSYVEVEDIIQRARKAEEDGFLVILDEIVDPHNLGSILRTSDACGVHGVIIPKRRAVGLTPVVVKSSAGAIEYVPVAKVTNIAQTIDYLKDQGYWIAGADMEGRDYYYQADLRGPIAIVIGSEGKGIGRLVKEKCDFLLRIPMKGGVSSLNAAVAGAILLYEVRRQRDQRE